jgi:hypothetical protein
VKGARTAIDPTSVQDAGSDEEILALDDIGASDDNCVIGATVAVS